MKATEQYFPVGLFIMLYKVVLSFESVDEIHSVTIKQYFPVVVSAMPCTGWSSRPSLWVKS